MNDGQSRQARLPRLVRVLIAIIAVALIVTGTLIVAAHASEAGAVVLIFAGVSLGLVAIANRVPVEVGVGEFKLTLLAAERLAEYVPTPRLQEALPTILEAAGGIPPQAASRSEGRLTLYRSMGEALRRIDRQVPKRMITSQQFNAENYDWVRDVKSRTELRIYVVSALEDEPTRQLIATLEDAASVSPMHKDERETERRYKSLVLAVGPSRAAGPVVDHRAVIRAVVNDVQDVDHVEQMIGRAIETVSAA